jgi:hypothetical protein
MAKKQEKWTRDPSFRKYFGSVFGISKSGNAYRLDVGNEKLQISEKEKVNVSECQIILPEDSFNVLVDLLCKVQNDEKEKTKKK